jgi:hypothetical protein
VQAVEITKGNDSAFIARRQIIILGERFHGGRIGVIRRGAF